MPRPIVIGTRGSRLALVQTDMVTHVLKAADPSVKIEVRVIQTQGDINQQPIPLDTIGKGWFTKEIEDALISGEIDIAVHSLKDVADTMPHGLTMGAYLPREDARDVLITKHGEPLEALKVGAVIGTDSARRQIQMLALKPDAHMQSLRGNVLTRLQKLESDGYDAVILAAAGLKRLGLEEKITRYFGLDEMIPAPGQGILAIQAHNNNAKLHELLDRINDFDTARIAYIERSFSQAMGGGCKTPTGAHAARAGDECVFTGIIAAENGKILRETIRAPWKDSKRLGVALAHKLLAMRK